MTEGNGSMWIPDASQREIIGINNGCHLVLAPPGCGKTQILAERIRLALDSGVSPDDMLCLTFTNRAARGMRERINERVGEKETEDVFVGNVHRFCSRFLFENGIVPAESAIIDDDDTTSILARYLNEDEERVSRDFRRKQAYSQIMFFAHLMYDIEHGVPKPLRMHPECVTKEDVAVMKAIGEAQGRPFDAPMMIDIYNHTDFYLDFVRQPAFSPLLRHDAEQTVLKMRFAHAYTAYKRQNNLLDFEDLLQFTYTALKTDAAHKRYSWVQVDEVQDLNMLQVEIIKGLSQALPEGEGCQYAKNTTPKPRNSSLSNQHPLPSGGAWGRLLLFLGDEQQAIFSFMGAKLTTLNSLKSLCAGNIHHLNVNHRSPRLLLEMLNAYAVANLGSDPRLLPQPTATQTDDAAQLRVCPYPNIYAEFNGVAKRAAELVDKFKQETTAIVVNSNRDADEISKALDHDGLPHFKVSGTDLFSTPEVKLLVAHLGVLANDMNFLAWARLMHGLKVCETPASARQFVHQLRARAIAPSDFLLADGETYLQRFIDIYESHDIVVFDTETTGLNVFEDDIIQIAAERIRQGKPVEKFCVYIETDRHVPTMLGDIANPIIEERKHQKLYSHKEVLEMFAKFVGNDTLLAHNAEFDSHILEYNIKRYAPPCKPLHCNGNCLDSLKLIRLLRPDLKAYKLKTLLAELGLQGENTHLADDDVNATVQLVNYCYKRGVEMAASQAEYLGRKTTQDRIGRLRRNYGEVYKKAVSRLYVRQPSASGVPALVDEMRNFYHWLAEAHWIKENDKIYYIFRYLAADIIDEPKEPSLKEQLDHHIMELSTFKEADLCGSSVINDRLFVSTIHKAKGLEFDNVLVFDAVDGRIPSFYHENSPQLLAEDARKLYVAMSRAKHRLFVCYAKQGASSGMPDRKLSRFMESVRKYFKG